MSTPQAPKGTYDLLPDEAAERDDIVATARRVFEAYGYRHIVTPEFEDTALFERGVGETASSGTGACGAAIAHVLRGGDSPVTVVLDGGELEVDVGEDLHVDLTGWAVPVYAGEATPELLASLGSAQ
jgi:hypothetical protein